jgi:hypothetical protein
MVCLLSGDSESVQKCHVIDKGRESMTFIEAYHEIYGNDPTDGQEDVRNTVALRSDIHTGPMDNLNQPQNLRIRRIVFDWVNRRCFIEDFLSGDIEEKPWIEGQTPNVKSEYFAYSNSQCTKRLKRYVRKNVEDPNLLFDYKHWASAD